MTNSMSFPHLGRSARGKGKELDTTEQLSLHIGEVNGNLEEKSPPAMQETLVRFLSWEDPLGKG